MLTGRHSLESHLADQMDQSLPLALRIVMQACLFMQILR